MSHHAITCKVGFLLKYLCFPATQWIWNQGSRQSSQCEPRIEVQVKLWCLRHGGCLRGYYPARLLLNQVNEEGWQITPKFPKPHKTFMVTCDVSKVAVGYALEQEEDGELHPVCLVAGNWRWTILQQNSNAWLWHVEFTYWRPNGSQWWGNSCLPTMLVDTWLQSIGPMRINKGNTCHVM